MNEFYKVHHTCILRVDNGLLPFEREPAAPSACATGGGFETIEADEFAGTVRVILQGNEVALIQDQLS